MYLVEELDNHESSLGKSNKATSTEEEVTTISYSRYMYHLYVTKLVESPTAAKAVVTGVCDRNKAVLFAEKPQVRRNSAFRTATKFLPDVILIQTNYSCHGGSAVLHH